MPPNKIIFVPKYDFMKTMILALCVTLCMAGCKEPAQPPTAVLDGMFTAMKKGNIEDMKKFITRTDIAMLDAAEKFMTTVDSAGVKQLKARMTEEFKANANKIQYSLSNEKIEDDHATVDATIITKDSAGQAVPKKHTFELVKEDNAWKIALSKPGNEMFNSMKGNMGAKKGDIKDGLERLQKMDPDSLRMLISKGLRAMDSMKNKKQQ